MKQRSIGEKLENFWYILNKQKFSWQEMKKKRLYFIWDAELGQIFGSHIILLTIRNDKEYVFFCFFFV